MNSDTKKLYIFTAIYFTVLLLVCFLPKKTTQIYFLAVFSIVYAICVSRLIKKRSIHNLHRKQATLILTAFAICSVSIYFITGVKFGYYNVKVSYSAIWLYIIPIVAIVIGTETIRSILLAQKKKFISVIVFFACTIPDILILSNVQAFSNFKNFMDTFALVVLPCAASNFLYHRVSYSFGSIAVVPYKLILFIYPYIFAIRPLIPESLLSFAKIVIPISIYFIIGFIYKTKNNVTTKTKKRLTVAITTVTAVIAISFIMLISGQFQYKLIVIATESMTGAINKGDVVIYEAYNEQVLMPEDIVVFDKDGALIVHRVVEITNINGEIRYYTKGDANENVDFGYLTDEQIVGVVKLKIIYMGYPSLWIRSLFT